jgi:subtilisin family serine protease
LVNPMEERIIGIPGDTLVHDYVYPMSNDLPSSAYHVTNKMRELHRRGIDGRGVTAAINDTGVGPHPFIGGTVHARDFTRSSSGPTDRHGHGSHCAGITKSIAPGVKIINAKVLGDSGSGSTTGINEGRIWAASMGADIISESLGDGGGPPIASDLAAYDKAYEHGTSICVAALGNAGYNGRNTVGRPGSYSSHNHGIGALQADWKTPTNFSSGGPAAAYAFPGANIVSCRPTSGWVAMSGTSMATPGVAGLYALFLQVFREQGYPKMQGPKAWTDFFLANNLITDLLTPGRDERTGYGLFNVEAMLDWLLAQGTIG